jgi:transcriptional regulator with XRE-family HTH domain
MAVDSPDPGQPTPPLDLPPERPIETFRRQVREVRRRRGLSQAALSARVRELGGSLTDTAITKIEGGSRDVSLGEALVLAAALGVAPLHLLFPIDGRPVRLVDLPNLYVIFPTEWAAGDKELRHLLAWIPPDQATPPEAALAGGAGAMLASDRLFPEDPIFDEWRPARDRAARRNHVYQLGRALLDDLGWDIYTAERFPDRDAQSRDRRIKRLQVRLRSFIDEMRLYLDEAGQEEGGSSASR